MFPLGWMISCSSHISTRSMRHWKDYCSHQRKRIHCLDCQWQERRFRPRPQTRRAEKLTMWRPEGCLRQRPRSRLSGEIENLGEMMLTVERQSTAYYYQQVQVFWSEHMVAMTSRTITAMMRWRTVLKWKRVIVAMPAALYKATAPKVGRLAALCSRIHQVAITSMLSA